MNTQNDLPDVTKILPVQPRIKTAPDDNPVSIQSLRPAVVALAILFIGFGLMLLVSLLQQESGSGPVEHLELPLPMPAGDLMAQTSSTAAG